MPRRDLLGLFILALALNTWAASFISRPGYMDAYYYFGGALQLARGKGFTEPYLWNYLTPLSSPLTSGSGLSIPSHLYWMPLTSIVAAPFIALAGVDDLPLELFHAAQIPSVILTSLLPLLTYAITSLITNSRRHALASASLTLFSGFYFLYWTTTDSFALYGVLGACALLGIALANVNSPLPPPSPAPLLAVKPHTLYFLTGLCLGLAHLTRADGILLLLLALVFTLQYASRLTVHASRFMPLTSHFLLIAFLLLGYLLPMLPWFFRNMALFGSPLAPGTGRALWLIEYDDLFSYPASLLTPARFFAQGWLNLLAGRWFALTTNLTRLMAEAGLVFATPFMLIGLWKLRRQPLYVPALVYLGVLFTVMTFVFPFAGARGGLFHSSAALLPFLFPAASIGLDAAVQAGTRFQSWFVQKLARFLPALPRLFPPWEPQKSQPIFTLLIVFFAAGFTGIIFYTRYIGPDWSQPRAARVDSVYIEIGNWLTAEGDSASIVASNNPPGFYFFTEHPGLIIPNGDADTLAQLLQDYSALWVALDSNHPAALDSLYQSPASDARFHLRATFTDSVGQPVYLFQYTPTP